MRSSQQPGRLFSQYSIDIAFDGDFLERIIVLNGVDCILLLVCDDVAENAVPVVIRPGCGAVGDEKLAAVGVGSSIGHR